MRKALTLAALLLLADTAYICVWDYVNTNRNWGRSTT